MRMKYKDKITDEIKRIESTYKFEAHALLIL